MADVTVPFSPISPYDFEKKLSAAECQDRQKKTTTFELDKLLRSEELLRWKAEALNASSVPLSRMLLLGFSTCILVLLLALATSRMQVICKLEPFLSYLIGHCLFQVVSLGHFFYWMPA